jgi:Tfp pilus assembly protein PilO
MEKLTRYRIPLLTALGALIVAIVVFVAWISPEGGKLSSLHAQQTQLLSQQSHLQTELSQLQREKAQVASNCQELTTDLTAIPGTPTVDAFFQQVTALAVSAGDPNTPSISVTQSAGVATPSAPTSGGKPAAGGTAGVKLVAVNLTLQGTYGQMSAFVHGLDSFPRLFTVTSFTVTGGPVAVGGAAINPSTGGYSLTLIGNVFYSTGQSNVCIDATTTAAH